MVDVTLWGALSSATEGKSHLEIEAATIRELFNKLEERYPLTKPFLERGIAVSIDGVIYRDDWSRELAEGSEVFLLPRLAGG